MGGLNPKSLVFKIKWHYRYINITNTINCHPLLIILCFDMILVQAKNIRELHFKRWSGEW